VKIINEIPEYFEFMFDHSSNFFRVYLMSSYQQVIQAVIFDCDGVLVDTIPLYASANSQIIGAPYPDSFQLTVNGLAEHDFAVRVIEGFGLHITPEEFVARREAIMKDLLPNAPLVVGVEAIVRQIYQMGIPIAVATSSNREGHRTKTAKHREFFKFFKSEICGDEVTKAKPAPEIFQKSAAALGNFPPQTVLVFEDSIQGIKAANAAGMASVFLANPNDNWKEALKDAGAAPTVVVEAFTDFDFTAFQWQKQ
jgi:pseudouridine-5'-monophosphatase